VKRVIQLRGTISRQWRHSTGTRSTCQTGSCYTSWLLFNWSIILQWTGRTLATMQSCCHVAQRLDRTAMHGSKL